MNLKITISVAALLALPLVATAQDSAPAAGSSTSSRASSSDIEIADLITRYAKRSGKQFILDQRVRAQVPLAGMDPDRVSYEKLLAILAVNQFVAVTQGDWIIVVPDANARQLPTPVYTDRNFKTVAPDEIATLIVNVRNVCAAQAVPVLRPLMPQAAHMAAYPETNTLILSDHSANLHRLVTVIEALERAGEKNSASTAECLGRFESKAAPGK
jgi:general secretion pathway protein D